MEPIPELHEYVLFEVFQYLSVSDRKNARLVCRLWRRVCSRATFVSQEAFFVESQYRLHTVVEVLERVQNETINFKFDARLFDASWNVVWENFGLKIRSLQLSGCEFHSEVVPRMFELCENLTEFSVQYSSSRSLPHGDRYEFSLRMLGDSIVAENLSTLRFSQQIDREGLLRIASSFPNLVNLKILLKVGENLPDFYFLLELLRTRLRRVSCLELRVLSCENYPYYIRDTYFNLDSKKIGEFDLSQLERMSISLFAPSLEGRGLNAFLCLKKIWTKIAIGDSLLSDVGNAFRSPNLTALARLIDENPQLEELSFTLNCSNMSEVIVVLRALVESKLKILKILTVKCQFTLDDFLCAAELLTTPLSQNKSLYSLVIDDLSDGTFVSSILIRYFRNIQHIHWSSSICKVLFEDEPNCLSLKIESDDKLGPISGHYESTVQQTVTALEFLQVDLYPEDKFFFKYNYPNLKYLFYNEKLFFGGNQRTFENVFDVLSHLRRSSPDLVGICFSHARGIDDAETVKKIFNFCLKFRQLCYIWMAFTDSYRFMEIQKDDVMQAMIECLPRSTSLRSVWVKREDTWEIRCFFNTFCRKFEFFESAPTIYSYEDIPFEYWRNKR